MNVKIKQLQKEIKAEEEKIRMCQHEYGKGYYNPETIKEGYGMKTVAHGSDVWSEFEGYHDVEKPRWTRKCSKCGGEQHTYNQKPIVTGQEPDFGK